MDAKSWTILIFVLPSILADVWRSSEEERKPYRGARKNIHYHSKRHMIDSDFDSNMKKRISSREARDIRKKPSGHLTPLEEDDIDNDEVISVAIAPPPIRPKFEKTGWKAVNKKEILPINPPNATVTNMVKDVLHQLGSEFLTHHVGEDFVFGQYLAIAMRNLTSDIKLKMQHDVLEIIMKYQRSHHNSHVFTTNRSDEHSAVPRNAPKEKKGEKKFGMNETDEAWPDFSNLQTIVG